MTKDSKFRFTAIDPSGAPRSGAVTASSALEASAKLSKRGFTSVLVEQEARAKKQMPSAPPRRETSGFRPTLRDRLSEFTGDFHLKLIAGVLVCFGLLLTVALWRPGAEPKPPQVAPEASEVNPCQWTIEARVEDWNPSDHVVFLIPALPYSWSQPAADLQDGQLFRHSIELQIPGTVKEATLLLRDGETGEQRAHKTIGLEGQSEQLDFGILRPKSQVD